MSKFNRINEAFVVVVSGDLAAYSKGDKLTKTMDIADYFREMCLLGDVTLTMDDDAIVTIVKSIPNQPNQDASEADLETWEQEVCSVLESRNKPNEVTGQKTSPLPDTRSDIAVASTAGTTAHLVGAKLAANQQFNDWLKAAAYAPEGVKVSPLNMVRGYLSVYKLEPDPDGRITDIQKSVFFDEIPSPQALPSKEYLAANGDKVRKDDYKKFFEFKIGAETYNWAEEALSVMPLGVIFKEELKAISDAKPGKGKQAKTRTGKYKNVSLTKLDTIEKLWTTRRTAALTCLKKAILALYQWRDIVVDMAGKVGVQFEMDNAGKPNATISEGFNTIVVYDKAAQWKATAFSISGFNNLDVEKANTDSDGEPCIGTWQDLMDSVKSGSRDTDKDAFSLELSKKGVDRFVEIMPELNTWIHGVGNVAEFQSAMLKRSKGEDAELGFDKAANDLKIQFVEIMRKLTPVYNHINSLSGGEFMGKLEAKRHNEEAEETAKGLAAGEGSKAA